MSEVILVVDDEKDLVSMLEYNLRKEGYLTLSANTGGEALALAEGECTPSALLLDLMLPDMSGVEVCRRLRANQKTRKIPIIMVSARSEEIDRVVGFEVGADDYVVKPFSIRELLLRLKGHVRTSVASDSSHEALEFGSLRIDEARHLVWVQQAEISFTALEFRLLLTLFSRRGRVQSRERLLQDVWGVLADVTTRTVDTHVKRVRKRLGCAGVYIETLRGVGYRFCDQVPQSVDLAAGG